MGSKNDLTYSRYKAMLENMLDKGYQFCEFDEANIQSHHVFLRHDIDINPLAALEIAKIEHSLSIRATYFFMATNPVYNLFDDEISSAINRIDEMNHYLGYHIDISGYAGMIKHRYLTTQAAMEKITGFSFCPVSLHRVGSYQLGFNDWPNEKVINVCEHPFFGTIVKYFSDSRGGWYDTAPDFSEEFDFGYALHICTHPEWWSETGEKAIDRIKHFFEMHKKRFHKFMSSDILGLGD